MAMLVQQRGLVHREIRPRPVNSFHHITKRAFRRGGALTTIALTLKYSTPLYSCWAYAADLTFELCTVASEIISNRDILRRDVFYLSKLQHHHYYYYYYYFSTGCLTIRDHPVR